MIGLLELVIARGQTQKLVDARRGVERRGRVEPRDALVGVELESGTKPEAGDALPIDGDQVQAAGRHVE